MGTAAPPACHPEPRAKDLVLEGSKMGSVHEILRLRLRMTVGPVREVLRLCLRMTMGTAALPACHPEPRAKDLVLEGPKMGSVHEILRLRLRMTVGPCIRSFGFASG